jgi:hypothetical protein
MADLVELITTVRARMLPSRVRARSQVQDGTIGLALRALRRIASITAVQLARPTWEIVEMMLLIFLITPKKINYTMNL